MFLFYVLSFFKKGDTIQAGTLLKGNMVITVSSFGKSEKNGFQDYDANGWKKYGEPYPFLMRGSCHLDRVSNVEIDVEYRMIFVVAFFNVAVKTHFMAPSRLRKGWMISI